MAFGKKNEVNLNPLSYSIMLLGESKCGKQAPLSEPVLTEDGWKPMGEITVGTKVFGEDGEIHNVTGIFPQGVKDVYEVTFRDGTKTRCGREHLWTVHTKKQRYNMRKYGDYRYKVLSLEEIMKDYKTEREIEDGITLNSYKYSIPINAPINFNIYKDEELEINPYILGLLLGDGGFKGNIVTFTNAEEDLFNELSDWCGKNNLKLTIRDFENHKQANIVKDKSDGNRKTSLMIALESLNLRDCGSREKFIPKKYLYCSIESRRALLSGIINTDGSISSDGTGIEISTYSNQLANDIAELGRGLGYIVTVNGYDRTSEDSTKKYDKEIEYHIRVIADDYSDLKLSSKHLSRVKGKEISYVKSIYDIKYVGKEECQCIMVDNPSELYITNDYIVTHNTTIVKEMCEKLVKEDGYLFLEIGQERGADAISGINYINTPEWNMDYDDLTNSAGFFDVCEDIIENKVSEYPNLQVVIWDTYDQLITIAEDKVISMWNKECRTSGHPEKCTDSINAAYGGFGKGEKRAIKLIKDMKASLKAVGVETIIIGHVKNKAVTDVVTGETYDVLTSDQQQNYFNAIKKDLHFLALAYVDREIVKESTGRKNAVTKKDEMVNKVKSESRKISFRDNSYSIDCGSRFADIVPECEMNADAFIKAMTDAILAEQAKDGKPLEEAKKEQAKIEEQMTKRVVEAEKEAKEKKTEVDEEENANLIEVIKANFIDLNKTQQAEVLSVIKEAGYNTFSVDMPTKLLRQVVTMVN